MISGLRICAVDPVVVTTFVAIGFWPPAPAAAQTQQQMDWCLNQGSRFPPDLRMGRCTASIQSGRWSGKALAWVYVSRGHAYDDKKNYDRAIADYNQAIQLDPKNANAYVAAVGLQRHEGLRPRHRRLRSGDPARSERCRRLRQPRPRLPRQEGLRPRHRRLRSGDPARSERCNAYVSRGLAYHGKKATTAPSPTTIRRSSSIRKMPTPISAAASKRRKGDNSVAMPISPPRRQSIRTLGSASAKPGSGPINCIAFSHASTGLVKFQKVGDCHFASEPGEPEDTAPVPDVHGDGGQRDQSAGSRVRFQIKSSRAGRPNRGRSRSWEQRPGSRSHRCAARRDGR